MGAERGVGARIQDKVWTVGTTTLSAFCGLGWEVEVFLIVVTEKDG